MPFVIQMMDGRSSICTHGRAFGCLDRAFHFGSYGSEGVDKIHQVRPCWKLQASSFQQDLAESIPRAHPQRMGTGACPFHKY